MRLRFIGENGSMGLIFGRVYRLRVEPHKNGVLVTAPVRCPYSSEDAFWRNWLHPDIELRTVMERRGRDLRELHLPKEDHTEHIHVKAVDLDKLRPEERSVFADLMRRLSASDTVETKES